jgi:phosphoglycolate phosphatase-like HAD superfamily hydrolase
VSKSGFLIFDLDGTLFRTETVTIPAVRHCFQELGIPVPPEDDIRSFFGKPTLEFHDWVRTISNVKNDSELVDSISRTELELISVTGELYPEIPEVLSILRGSVEKMAICSNGTGEYVPRVLSELCIIEFFDTVSYRGDSGHDKPFMVRELLEFTPGPPAIVIGDRWDDIEAAHENAIGSIAAGYGYGKIDELKHADAVADEPGELTFLVPHLLEKMYT